MNSICSLTKTALYLTLAQMIFMNHDKQKAKIIKEIISQVLTVFKAVDKQCSIKNSKGGYNYVLY